MMNYEESVYAGVLGKVIGVYMGRPFEGWRKERIQETFGSVDRFVYEEVGKPLVVADDDISGTFTFWRVLEDTGSYSSTPVERFGDNWLNYIIPGRSILWWGGVGVSTEHTAFRRLQDGMRAPGSGSIRTNGRTVAEQIGAQIFIDAFGLVCPGKPETAAELAGRAGSVSHDGESVYAAQVTAAMEAAAFTEKDMERLLDIGVSVIPGDSLTARVHRDIRTWCRRDRHWERTFERIDAEYGYRHFGGNCHVIPNHAIMVMAWSYAPEDFHLAQEIINTAGWDTDCNAANVGCLMGVKLGLPRIEERYPYRRFFADRIVLPTAEGTYTVSDCLTEALRIAHAGRRIMGWPERESSASTGGSTVGTWHHFSLPGALHGYMAEDRLPETRGTALVDSVPCSSVPGDSAASMGADGYCMRIRAEGLGRRRTARVSTPVWSSGHVSGYRSMTVPRLCSGMTVTADGACGEACGEAVLRSYVRLGTVPPGSGDTMVYSDPLPLDPGEPFSVPLVIPDTGGIPVSDFGIEISGEASAKDGPGGSGEGGPLVDGWAGGLSAGRTGASAEVFIRQVRFDSTLNIAVPEKLPVFLPEPPAVCGPSGYLHGKPVTMTAQPEKAPDPCNPPGWLSAIDNAGNVLSNIRNDLQFLGKNDGWGFLATGTRDWRNYRFSAEVLVHSAAAAGMFVRYQGIRRFMGISLELGRIRIIRRRYEESIRWEREAALDFDRLYSVEIEAVGGSICFRLDGDELCRLEEPDLLDGGIGFFVDRGNMGFKNLCVEGSA